MYIFLFALCTSWVFVGVSSECPNLNDLPVLNDGGDEFYCAWLWWDWGDEEPIRGCNGNQQNYMDNTDYDCDDGKLKPVGSLMVKAGCTFYGYKDYHYKGSLIKYTGPATFPNGCSGGSCPPDKAEDSSIANGFHSFQCRCLQDPIICQPTDEWVTIIQCDNTESSIETTCEYTKTIGTSWSSEAQNSMSIDSSIEYSMSASFFNIFEESIGISVTTGYDWSHTSSQAKSETETFKVAAVVPPYTLLQINGAEGNCGDNNVKTELFKTITWDPEGNFISETLEFPDNSDPLGRIE